MSSRSPGRPPASPLRRQTRTQQRHNRVTDPGVQSAEAMNHSIGGGIGHNR